MREMLEDQIKNRDRHGMPPVTQARSELGNPRERLADDISEVGTNLSGRPGMGNVRAQRFRSTQRGLLAQAVERGDVDAQLRINQVINKSAERSEQERTKKPILGPCLFCHKNDARNSCPLCQRPCHRAKRCGVGDLGDPERWKCRVCDGQEPLPPDWEVV